MTASASPAARPAPARPRSIIPLAAGLFAVLPLSTDIYLTAMVDLGRDFGVDISGVQQTMLSFTLGFGLAHLFIGRFADRFGRRPTALVGIAVFTAASVLAVVAPSLDLLIVARFLQGMAAATGPIVSRTLIRDTVPSEGAGRAQSQVGALVGIAPLTAPLIGTFAAQFGGWRAAIAVLVVFGAALSAVLWRLLPETRPTHVHGATDISVFRALGHLVRHRAFVIGSSALAAGYGVLLTWLTTSAFLLVGTLGMSKLEASAIYALGSGGYVAGALLAARLAQHLLPRFILRIGAGLILLGTILPAIGLGLGFHHWAAVLPMVFPFYFGWGLAQPMAIAVTMRPFPEMAGQASAWLGLLQQLGGILLSLVAAHYGGGSATLVVMMVGAALFAGAVFVPPAKTH